MSNELFLSIIIPIYNGAKVIDRCLESIWEQRMDTSMYEVICVNDCSSDDTESVIQKSQYTHENLRLLCNSVNKRAGGSRNYGVREARGKYIVFIDADDYFHVGCFWQILDNLIRTNIDILMCDFARETEQLVSNEIFLKYPSNAVLSGRDFLVTNGVPFGPCKYFFKRELMTLNSIYFEENVCCEDVDWVHKITLVANSIQYQPILLSHVIINEESQTANEHRSLKTIAEKFFAGYRMYQLSELYSGDVEVCRRLRAVADIYYMQGVKYFTAINANIRDKVSVLERYFPQKNDFLRRTVRFAMKNPFVYSILTNLTAPIVRYIIHQKRKIKGR